MSRVLKILGILIVTVVAVAVFAAIVFMLVFDPNDYKDKIAAGVKEATGRELVIEGDLRLSLFPWLAVEMGKTELGNAPGFDDAPFASFESARLSVPRSTVSGSTCRSRRTAPATGRTSARRAKSNPRRPMRRRTARPQRST